MKRATVEAQRDTRAQARRAFIAPTSGRAVAALFALLAWGSAQAQLPPIDQPPPSIQFQDWKQTPSEENQDIYDESFPSAVQTPFPENNTVPLRIFLPSQRTGPVPCVVLLHYWGATDLSVETELARELNQRSIGAIAITLPYHMSRTPKGYRSGELAIAPDPGNLAAMMTQSVLDVRRTIDFIESRPEFDHQKIGISGTSLGALVAVMAYAVDNRITDAAFMLGGIDIAHIIWRSSLIPGFREDLRHQGFSEQKLETTLAGVEPGNYLNRRSSGNAFVVGAKYDTVVPPADTRKLIKALPGAKVLWLDTGHYGGVFVEKRLLRTVAIFFGDSFKGLVFNPPSRLYAPTLRLGAIADTGDGFQLGAGVDILKAGPHNDFFSSVIFTPKGLNLFAGFALGQGLAVGGFATPHKVSLGIWWSTVL